MKHFALLLLLVVIFGGAVLLSGVAAANVPVPYYDQRLHIGPLSLSEMAYLKRLVDDADDDMLEERTTQRVTPVDDGSDAWDNSCVSEAVNEGGFSNEDEPAVEPPGPTDD